MSVGTSVLVPRGSAMSPDAGRTAAVASNAGTPPRPVEAGAAVSFVRPTFDPSLLEEHRTEKIVIVEFGGKGVGKTYDMYSLPGRKLVLSFDGKSQGIKDGSYGSDPNIRVFDATHYYSDFGQPEHITFSGMMSVEYINWGLEQLVAVHRPHWIIFDGLTVLINIAEAKMRYLHGVATMSEGFRELAWWKDRSLVIKQLHRKAASMSLIGVAYTADYAFNVADEGSSDVRTTAKDAPDRVPKWVDIIQKEADIVVEKRTYYSSATKERVYEAYVQNSKDHLRDILETGKVIRIPQRGHIPWGPGLAARYEATEKLYGSFTPTPAPVSTVPFEAKHDYSTGEMVPVAAPVTTLPSNAPPEPAAPRRPVSPSSEEF